MWREESTAATRKAPMPTFSLCCNGGKIRLPPARQPPQYLKELMTSEDSECRHFREYIRVYNGVFCFTSMGGKVQHTLNSGNAPYIYSIGGQIFHRLGSLIPSEGNSPQFAQLYVHDTNNEIEHRMTSSTDGVYTKSLSHHIVRALRDMFDENNVLVKVFRYARDRLNANDLYNVKIKLLAKRISDGREYDLPAVDELAILVVDETGGVTHQPDVMVQHLSNEMERVSFYHPSLMALQYPILFPYGEDGWHPTIMLRNTNNPTNCVSQCDYYAYRIQTRLQESSTLLISGRLFQQYVVNAYALVEAERLDWIQNNQTKLRKHYFHGLVDAYKRGDSDLRHTGKHIILASSHTGSPRYKYENFQDAVAICRTLGYPEADVLARVFKVKLNQLMLEIKTKAIFGTTIAFVHTTEFQKRGLPHAHMLVFLSAEDKIHCASQIDSVISAEIPDSSTDPECYDAVSRFMFHGPCGPLFPQAPCTFDRKCTKHFPKKNNPETTMDQDGFPRYRRREDGRRVLKNRVYLDNRYVVPYNRYLLLRFDAHINVEFCNKSRAIKYLFKYINKPPDRAMAAGQYTYVEFPQHYTWIPKDKIWRERQKKVMIARLYYCHPSSEERFYLRMLLHVVKGCTSFEDIEACSAYGFLADDGEWNHCLREVSLTATSKQMRTLFVRIIMFCQVSSVGSLWGENWHFLSDDIQSLRRKQLNIPDLQVSLEDQQNLCLLEIQKLLEVYGKSLSDFPGLPVPTTAHYSYSTNSLLAQELEYDHVALEIQSQIEIGKLNLEQQQAYDEIMESVQSNSHKISFIDGFGGTGKTFLWKVLSMKLRSERKVVLCVASSGIAALLMIGGRTTHSRFHIPVDVHSTSTCHIEQDSDLARTLRDIMSRRNRGNLNLPFGGITVVFGGDFRQTLPVIPKATRTEIVNSSIKRSDLWDHMRVIKLCQNMRLHREGCSSDEATEIEAFSKWIVDIGNGESSTIYGDSQQSIPPDIMVEHKSDPIVDIVQATYSSIQQNYSHPTYFADRAILAPLHEIVSSINDYMLAEFPGKEACYYSSDNIESDGVEPGMLEAEFPTEFLNSMRIGNFSDHELKLKVGAPVILLRNIDQSTGLCNGTRLIVKSLGTWCIEVEVMTGSHAGDKVYLPRITLASKEKSLNFTLLRRQYPIALCFAMTINKSQGQTLHEVGICLKRQVFTHGQLYVALSRVTTKKGLKILSCDEDGKPVNFMKNIVFREVLN
ncbi:ATP-dependent DNA helicase PIF1 [Linum perenne]